MNLPFAVRAAALLALAAAFAAPAAAQPATVQTADAPRALVAVLPFEIHSEDDLSYLGDSLAERLAAGIGAGGPVDTAPAAAVAQAQRQLAAAAGEAPPEARARAVAQALGAQWAVQGSLTQLAGHFSLDARVVAAQGALAPRQLSYSAAGDEQLLQRMDELAARVVALATGEAAQLRVAALRIEGARDEAELRAALQMRPGDEFSSAQLREEVQRLEALPEVASARAETETTEDGVQVLFTVVPAERLALSPGAAGGESRIAAVKVRGNLRIEEAAIRARIRAKAGGALSPARVASDVRAIYQLGFFQNIRVLSEAGISGRTLIYEVEENPVVRQVTITGNDEVDEEKIRDNLTLTTGSTLDLPLIFENRLRIEAIYRAEGFYLARVSHEVETLPAGAVAVHFSVNEGEKLRLRAIKFEGNEAFSEEELKEGFKTKEWAWHSLATSFINKSGVYAEPVFRQDLRSIQDRYLDLGYVRAEIGEPEVEADDDGLEVLVRISEGPQFRVRKLDVRGDESVDAERLRGRLKLKEGELFNRSALNDDVERLEHEYTDRGFYAAEVDPRTRVAESDALIDVIFEVEKGPLYFLREIEVAGNTNTIDPVVRREMRMVEGELYSARQVDVSKRRVERLGYFEEVNIEPKLTDFEDQLDLGIKVVERPTGSLSFGAGFSSRDGFVLSGSIVQSNLFGRGYSGALSADFGGNTDRYTFSFSDPYFLGSTFGFSARTFQTDIEFDDFRLNQLGAEFVLSHLLDTEGTTRAFLRYSWVNRDVRRNINAFAAAPILREILSGSEAVSAINLSVRRDTRNDRITPTRGQLAELSLDFAGLGGFAEYARLEARSVSYLPNPSWIPAWLPSAEDGTWVIGAQAGWAFPFNDVGDFDLSNLGATGGSGESGTALPLDQIDTDIKLPLSERYFLGGIGAYQLRGFEGRSVGPRRARIARRVSPEGEGPVFDVLGRGGADGACLDNAMDGANLGGDRDGICNDITDRDIDDFEDLDETDAIGGNKFFAGTLEYRFPISEELGIIGIAFLDFGNAFHEDENIWEAGLWRFGSGVGALWFSPFGPLQAFLGVPLDAYDHEDSTVFEFSVGGQAF